MAIVGIAAASLSGSLILLLSRGLPKLFVKDSGYRISNWTLSGASGY